MKYIWMLPVLVLLIFVTSCGGVVGPEVARPAHDDPEPGKTTMVGRIVSVTDGQPVPDTIVRLAEVVRQGDEGAFVLDGAFSPGATTDDNGYFAMENILPSEYVLVVGDVYSVHEVIADSRGDARTWIADPDQIIDVGTIRTKIGP